MLHKFFTDKYGHVVIMQKPNLALIVWAVAALTASLLPAGSAADGFRVASRTAIIIWAGLEVGQGASYFRRLLGAIVLIWSLGSLFW